MKSIARSLAVEMALQQRAMGRRIAQLRERAHFTQEVAADKAGVTLRAFQKWEAGGGIQYANLQKLAEALDVSVEQITGETETPNPFRISDQMDGGFDEFREHVGSLHARLDQIQAELETASTERQDLSAQLEQQNQNLTEQSTILHEIRGLAAETRELVAVLRGVTNVLSERAAAGAGQLSPLPEPVPGPIPFGEHAAESQSQDAKTGSSKDASDQRRRRKRA